MPEGRDSILDLNIRLQSDVEDVAEALGAPSEWRLEDLDQSKKASRIRNDIQAAMDLEADMIVDRESTEEREEEDEREAAASAGAVSSEPMQEDKAEEEAAASSEQRAVAMDEDEEANAAGAEGYYDRVSKADAVALARMQYAHEKYLQARVDFRIFLNTVAGDKGKVNVDAIKAEDNKKLRKKIESASEGNGPLQEREKAEAAVAAKVEEAEEAAARVADEAHVKEKAEVEKEAEVVDRDLKRQEEQHKEAQMQEPEEQPEQAILGLTRRYAKRRLKNEMGKIKTLGINLHDFNTNFLQKLEKKIGRRFRPDVEPFIFDIEEEQIEIQHILNEKDIESLKRINDKFLVDFKELLAEISEIIDGAEEDEGAHLTARLMIDRQALNLKNRMEIFTDTLKQLGGSLHNRVDRAPTANLISVISLAKHNHETIETAKKLLGVRFKHQKLFLPFLKEDEQSEPEGEKEDEEGEHVSEQGFTKLEIDSMLTIFKETNTQKLRVFGDVLAENVKGGIRASLEPTPITQQQVCNWQSMADTAKSSYGHDKAGHTILGHIPTIDMKCARILMKQGGWDEESDFITVEARKEDSNDGLNGEPLKMDTYKALETHFLGRGIYCWMAGRSTVFNGGLLATANATSTRSAFWLKLCKDITAGWLGRGGKAMLAWLNKPRSKKGKKRGRGGGGKKGMSGGEAAEQPAVISSGADEVEHVRATLEYMMNHGVCHGKNAPSHLKESNWMLMMMEDKNICGFTDGEAGGMTLKQMAVLIGIVQRCAQSLELLPSTHMFNQHKCSETLVDTNHTWNERDWEGFAGIVPFVETALGCNNANVEKLAALVVGKGGMLEGQKCTPNYGFKHSKNFFKHLKDMEQDAVQRIYERLYSMAGRLKGKLAENAAIDTQAFLNNLQRVGEEAGGRRSATASEKTQAQTKALTKVLQERIAYVIDLREELLGYGGGPREGAGAGAEEEVRKKRNRMNSVVIAFSVQMVSLTYMIRMRELIERLQKLPSPNKEDGIDKERGLADALDLYKETFLMGEDLSQEQVDDLKTAGGADDKPFYQNLYLQELLHRNGGQLFNMAYRAREFIRSLGPEGLQRICTEYLETNTLQNFYEKYAKHNYSLKEYVRMELKGDYFPGEEPEPFSTIAAKHLENKVPARGGGGDSKDNVYNGAQIGGMNMNDVSNSALVGSEQRRGGVASRRLSVDLRPIKTAGKLQQKRREAGSAVNLDALRKSLTESPPSEVGGVAAAPAGVAPPQVVDMGASYDPSSSQPQPESAEVPSLAAAAVPARAASPQVVDMGESYEDKSDAEPKPGAASAERERGAALAAPPEVPTHEEFSKFIDNLKQMEADSKSAIPLFVEELDREAHSWKTAERRLLTLYLYFMDVAEEIHELPDYTGYPEHSDEPQPEPGPAPDPMNVDLPQSKRTKKKKEGRRTKPKRSGPRKRKPRSRTRNKPRRRKPRSRSRNKPRRRAEEAKSKRRQPKKKSMKERLRKTLNKWLP